MRFLNCGFDERKPLVRRCQGRDGKVECTCLQWLGAVFEENERSFEIGSGGDDCLGRDADDVLDHKHSIEIARGDELIAQIADGLACMNSESREAQNSPAVAGVIAKGK